jgi:predicted TIM-barrel fold metal-dependent hydrolase
MFPKVVSTIRGRKDISDSAKEQILGGNAARFYGWERG